MMINFTKFKRETNIVKLIFFFIKLDLTKLGITSIIIIYLFIYPSD